MYTYIYIAWFMNQVTLENGTYMCVYVRVNDEKWPNDDKNDIIQNMTPLFGFNDPFCRPNFQIIFKMHRIYAFCDGNTPTHLLDLCL